MQKSVSNPIIGEINQTTVRVDFTYWLIEVNQRQSTLISHHQDLYETVELLLVNDILYV